MRIDTVKDFKTTLRSPYAWPGGYPRYFITSDGATLSMKTAQEEFRLIASAIKDKRDDGWRVTCCGINWEDTDLIDDHSGKLIESAYGGNN